MIQRISNQTWNQLDIAYSYSSKYSSRLSNGITHGLDMDHYNTVVQKFEFWTCDFVEAGPIESPLLVNS